MANGYLYEQSYSVKKYKKWKFHTITLCLSDYQSLTLTSWRSPKKKEPERVSSTSYTIGPGSPKWRKRYSSTSEDCLLCDDCIAYAKEKHAYALHLRAWSSSHAATFQIKLGLANGKVGVWKNVHALHNLCELLGQRHSTARSHHGCRTLSRALSRKLGSQSVGLWRAGAFSWTL